MDRRLHRRPSRAIRSRAPKRVAAAVACFALATCGCSSVPGAWGVPECTSGRWRRGAAQCAASDHYAARRECRASAAVAQPTVALQPVLRPPPGVQLSPGVVVAPLNTNVIMVAGVYSPERELMPFQPIEWSLAPEALGRLSPSATRQIRRCGHWSRSGRRHWRPIPRLAKRSAIILVITRGTASPRDDLTILRGQTWIGLTSAVEGDCVVTALSPAIDNPSTRQQTAVIHWVDVLWKSPPPTAALPGARAALTTRGFAKNIRRTACRLARSLHDQRRPAGRLAPNGAAQLEVPTDAQGQAIAEVVQPAPATGVNPITVQLVRPAIAGCERLDIGTGTTLLTWTTSAPPVSAIPSPVAPVQPAPVPVPVPTIIAPPITAPPITPLPVTPPAIAPPIMVSPPV